MTAAERREQARAKFTALGSRMFHLSERLAKAGYRELAKSVQAAGKSAERGDLPAARAELKAASSTAELNGLAGAAARIDVLEEQLEGGN